MALRDTGPLRRELARTIPSRPFEIEFWDGTRLPSENGGPSFAVRSPAAIAHILRAPGQLGLGRAYATGGLEVDDLDEVMRLLDGWNPPPIAFEDRLRLASAALRAVGPALPPRAPAAELRPRGRRHTIDRDRRAVRHHYDVSNDFFRDVARRVHDLQLRDLLPRRRQPWRRRRPPRTSSCA